MITIISNKMDMISTWNENSTSRLVTPANYRWWLALIFLVGAFFRLNGITSQVLIDDEWHALNAVQYHDWTWIISHFGDSDHSIPLALLYELQYHLTGLNELLMRWPMLLAGCLAPLLVPHMIRHWLNRPERLMLAALLAISPLLIYYSRFARPYSLLVLLEFGALLMSWHWWQSRQFKYACGWILLSGVSAWLNTPALIVLATPFLYLGIIATKRLFRDHDWSGCLGLLAIGTTLLAMLALLMGPALITQPGALATKAGQHFINWTTLPWALSLVSGSGYVWVYASMLMLALVGYLTMRRRDTAFAHFTLFCCVTSVLILAITGAAFSLHGNIFLRYTIGLVPFYLSFCALGFVQIALLAFKKTNPPAFAGTALALAGVVLLFWTGPIPDWPLRHNQFITHQNYHFHYDWSQNLYKTAMNDWYQAEHFYEEIAAAHPPGEALIVEAPWYMESYSNPINLQQTTHKQRVRIGFINGVCAGPIYGEITAGQPGMQFQNFVYLKDLLDGRQQADYLVLRRHGMPEFAREIKMDFETCESAVRDVFGEPWRESPSALVFKIRPQE